MHLPPGLGPDSNLVQVEQVIAEAKKNGNQVLCLLL